MASLLAIFAAGIFGMARAQAPNDFDFNAQIDAYFESIAPQLPPGQRQQLDAYRQYLKESISSIIPPGTIEQQLKAAEELFPLPPEASQEDPKKPAGGTSSDPSLTLSAEPASPSPRSSVTVSANFLIGGGLSFPDIQKEATTRYTWFLDNRRMEAVGGIGRNTFTFTAGTLGAMHTIRLQAQTSGGSVITAALLIPIVDADIIWYTDTYTPPGYRGKALATPQNAIVAVAMPFIPASFGPLNYVWTIDDDTPLNGYGIGKNRMLIGFPFQTHTVSVRISDLGGNIDFSKEIFIARTEPEVLLHRARGDRTNHDTLPQTQFDLAPASTFSIVAVPYYFGVQTMHGLRFTWQFDGARLPEAVRNPDMFTLNIGQATLGQGKGVQKTLALQIDSKNPKKTEQANLTIPVVIR